MNRIFLPLVLVAIALTSRRAEAITCSVVSVSGVSFGTYDVLSVSPVDTAGTLTFNCTSVLGSDNIVVDISAGGSSSFAARELVAGSDVLEYNLYTNAGRSTVWGDGSSGTSHYGPANPPNGTNFSLTVYGRVPAQQDVPAGSYTDTVVVTIQY